MKQENFPFELNGEKYWVSRSMATATFVYKKINGKWYVLANKRGPGLPTNVGKWNCPSGYLDYDETLEQCACREVFEETGIKIYPVDLNLMNIDSDPSRAKNQNVVVRYATVLRDSEDYNCLTNKNSEPNEVDEIRWISLDDVDKYEWTSARHLWCIKNYLNKIL